MVLELPESAAQVATDPNRVYYVGAGYTPCLLPGLLFFLTRPCLRPCPSLRTVRNMLDGLRQGLVSSICLNRSPRNLNFRPNNPASLESAVAKNIWRCPLRAMSRR